MFSRSFLAAALAVTAAAPAFAQTSSPGYFIPPSQPQSSPAATPKPQAQAAPAPQFTMPPLPNVPDLPAAPPPPAPVIGVLSVPDVLRNSTAAQKVQAEIQKREQALAAQAQDARAQINAEQQQIAAQKSALTEAAFDAKVQDLQNQVAATRTKFQLKNQAIQNSGQAAIHQVELELINIIKKEAAAHGMNLILQQDAVALNFPGFDITEECTKELNKLLPSVPVPPSVVTPGMTVNQPDQTGQDGQ